ncbi:MAG TPA: Gldg family protein [Gemmatimonadaceae bacterium]
MTRILTIARRELRGYFDHPTAYILIIAFLALGLFLTFRTLYVQRIATLRPMFDLLPWLMAVFVPAITMRALAEERRNRTLEWLMAQPLGERDVVLGKFLGDLWFVLLALAGTLPTAIGILAVSEADGGAMVAQYVGAALLGAQLVAVGLWASSITRNQITAFILATTISLALVLMGLPVVSIGLPPLLAGIVSRLSVIPHFANVARGVIDLRDVIYFVSMTGLFLALAGFAVSRERLSRQRGAYRRLRLGTAVVVVGVLLVNLLGGYIHGRLDLTRGGLYTLAPGTRTLVENLPDLVQARLFVSDELPPEVQLLLRDVRDLLADMARASDGRLRVTESDPDDDSTAAREAQSLGLQPTTFNVLRDDEFQVRRGWFGLALLYANERRVIPIIDRTDDLEFRLASYLSSMTATSKPRVAFLSGFGARSPFEFRALQEAVSERFEVRYIDLEQDSVPLPADSFRVAFYAAPMRSLDSGATARLNAYLDGGGSALFLVETAQIGPSPQPQPATGGLGPLLADRGLGLRDGLVYDLRAHENVSVGRQGIFSLVRGYPLWPIVLPASEHATTRNLENLTLGWAAALEVKDTAHVQPLWATTQDAGVRPVELPIDPEFASMGGESQGVQIVAAAVDPGADGEGNGESDAARGGRMIVVGDADFLSDRFVQGNPQNLIFVANALDWLAQDEMLIRIRTKVRTPPALVFQTEFGRGALKWGSLVGVPLLFVAIGALRIGRREARARRQWGSAPARSTTDGAGVPAPEGAGAQ